MISFFTGNTMQKSAHKGMLLLAALIGALALLGGCSIRLTSSSIVDGGVFRSDDAGSTWQQKVLVSKERKKTVTISGVDVNGIYPSPHNDQELAITTAANGVYTTMDNGEHWTASALPNGAYTSFAYDQKNTAIQYTATGVTIRKSSDGGGTWATVYTDARGQAITALLVDWYDDARVFAATSTGTILKSLDYGSSWSVQKQSGDTIRSFLASDKDSRVLYAITANTGLLKTVNSGDEWIPVQGLSDYSGANRINGATEVGDSIYLATDYGLLVSSDGGTTWKPITTLVPFGTLPLQSVAVDPNNTNVIYFSVRNLIHVTEDGGAQWRTIDTIPTKRKINKLVIHPSQSSTIFAGVIKAK